MRCVLTFLLLFASPMAAAEFWASPYGTPNGGGTRARPWDISTALTHPAAVRPGDEILLADGLYSLDGPLVSRLLGETGRPIRVRGAPDTRVVLDCAPASRRSDKVSCLRILGAHAWYEGFEIFNSRKERHATIPGAAANPRGIGIESRSGPGVKLINLIVHDVGLALFESQPSGIEIYGLIAYNNGWDGPDRSHGPGIYIRNKTGWPSKRIEDSIVFQNYRQGLQGYGTRDNVFSHMTVVGSTFFNNGIGRDGPHRNLMFGNSSGNHVGNRFRDNSTFYPDGASGGNLFGSAGGCRGLQLIGNVFAHGRSGTAATINCSANVSVEGNVFEGEAPRLPENFYEPSGTQVHVRPNRYNPHRVLVTVHNWDRASTVQVDLAAAGVPQGAELEVRSVQDPFGDPLRLTYDDVRVSLPMTGWKVTQPIGWSPDRRLPETFPEFGVFVVTWRRTALSSY